MDYNPSSLDNENVLNNLLLDCFCLLTQFTRYSVLNKNCGVIISLISLSIVSKECFCLTVLTVPTQHEVGVFFFFFIYSSLLRELMLKKAFANVFWMF